jgi:hypothetical protein
MKLQILTSETAASFVGQTVLYTTRGDKKLSKINSVSSSGKTIYINNPDLKNALQTVSRKIYVVLDS